MREGTEASFGCSVDTRERIYPLSSGATVSAWPPLPLDLTRRAARPAGQV